MTVKYRARRASAALAIAAAVGLTAPCAALAQATSKEATMARADALGDVRKVSETVTIVSIDRATRHLVVRKGSGDTASIKVPPEVQRFGELKVGDTITATYTVETEFALSQPNQPLPQDTDTLVAARAQSGELPAAVVANRVVVTGAVLGVDTTAHTLRIVSPQGGEVHTFDVKSAEGRRLMGQLKPGDKITAYITESILLSVDRS
jgi:hypothetical protein